MPMSGRLLRPRASGTALHPEVRDWIARVTTNGGTASTNTLSAMSQFCAAIDAAGIRDRFYRLNLFCGNQLAAALVPLYRGQSHTGTQVGGTADANNNLVSGDYVETGSSTGGLKGNGSNKNIGTGLNPVTIGASTTDFHLSCYVRGAEASGTSRAMIGNDSLLTTGLGWIASGSTEAVAIASNNRVNASIVGWDGFLAGSVGSGRLQTYYRNGSAIATASGPGGQQYENAAITVLSSGASSLFSLARHFRAYSIGLELTAPQWASFNTAMQTFQTALGRNV